MKKILLCIILAMIIVIRPTRNYVHATTTSEHMINLQAALVEESQKSMAYWVPFYLSSYCEIEDGFPACGSYDNVAFFIDIMLEKIFPSFDYLVDFDNKDGLIEARDLLEKRLQTYTVMSTKIAAVKSTKIGLSSQQDFVYNYVLFNFQFLTDIYDAEMSYLDDVIAGKK